MCILHQNLQKKKNIPPNRVQSFSRKDKDSITPTYRKKIEIEIVLDAENTVLFGLLCHIRIVYRQVPLVRSRDLTGKHDVEPSLEL